ncbi:MAG: hypothetical protein Q9191_003103 [Dirinaria sp. TL-2023a]
MAIGASFGRMVGILVQALRDSFPHAKFFAACEPDVPCITPGTYAFLGAAAALSGIMHITIVVGVTKAVGDRFGKGGIADRMIWFNGFPFLDNKEEHTFGVPVSQVMTSEVTSLPATGLNMTALEKILSDSKYQGFPIVEDHRGKILIGYIGRTELRYAITKTKKEGFISPRAKCLFTQPASTAVQTPSTAAPAVTFDAIEAASGQQTVEFGRFIDPTPLAVHPRLPLETVMELFKKMGPRSILVEYRGRLVGLVTVKDCLKYQFKVEAHDASHGDPSLDERQAKLWDMMNRLGIWIADRVMSCTGGRIKLGAARPIILAEADTRDPRDHLSPIQASSSLLSSSSRYDILDGTEADAGVELQDRREE